AFVVAFSALSYTARFTGPRPPRDVAYRWESSAGALLQVAVVFAIVMLIALGRDKRQFFALRPPESWAQAAAISLGIVVVVVVVAQALSAYVDPEAEQGLTPTYWDGDRVPQFAAYAFAVVVAGPIVEELVFRGAGFTLLEPLGRWTAVVVVGIAFGLAHGLLEGLPIITAFGLGLAYLRSRTRSLYPCVILHSLFNATALILGLTT
ncbi:MAG: lysostaphin resistance A-like protein, partial [Gaiellaceae bacterium]